MEGFGGLGFSMSSNTIRKRRSNTSRRPCRNDPQPLAEFYDGSSLSSTPCSSEMNKIKVDGRVSRDLNGGSSDDSFGIRGKEKRSEGLVASSENTVKKVKLKVNGVTRTIDTKPMQISDASWPMQIVQETPEKNCLTTSDKDSRFRGLQWRDVSEKSLTVGQADNINPAEQPGSTYQALRKSKRVPKWRIMDDDGDDDDCEIRYLEKVKRPKSNAIYGGEDSDDEGGLRKHRRLSKVMKQNSDGLDQPGGLSRSSRKGSNSRSGHVYEDADYIEEERDEEELSSDAEVANKRKQAKKYLDSLGETKRVMTVTTRQRRASQSTKNVSSGSGPAIVEFPHGLPPAPPRRQREKLSEVEQQLKKAEAAQRRRMQVEKAARESEAEAIRKILGQDPSRKRREEKTKRRQEKKAKEKVANSVSLKSDTVRWVMGPSGTVVTFPSEVGLPKIFDSKPSSYPPVREQCAGPSCTNPYKYRDSKSKLPLCSLRCYKAVQEKPATLSAC